MLSSLERLGSELGFDSTRQEIAREYMLIDVGFFSVSEGDADLWDFEVAIEHENHGDKWFDELVKLAHVQCGLRVLISYFDYASERRSLTSVLRRAEHLLRVAQSQVSHDRS